MQSHRLGVSLLITSIVILLLAIGLGLNVSYWLLPPKEKFNHAWKQDIELLESSHKLPAQWREIRQVSVQTDHSPAQNWVDKNTVFIPINPKGHYLLNVFIIHWIEDIHYGAMIQYSLVDLRDENTIWELGRTLRLGYVY